MDVRGHAGVLIEFAADGPGYTVDESRDELEDSRDEIEAGLPPLSVPANAD